MNCHVKPLLLDVKHKTVPLTEEETWHELPG